MTYSIKTVRRACFGLARLTAIGAAGSLVALGAVVLAPATASATPLASMAIPAAPTTTLLAGNPCAPKNCEKPQSDKPSSSYQKKSERKRRN